MLICIGGLPGSGKTTLGYRLKEFIENSAVICPDRHFLIASEKDPEKDILTDDLITAEKIPGVIAAMWKEASTLLKEQTVIIPSSFIGAQMRKDYETMAANRQVDFQGIWLQADYTKRAGRTQQRAHDHEARIKQGLKRGFNASAINSRKLLQAVPEGDIGWAIVDADQPRETVFINTIRILENS